MARTRARPDEETPGGPVEESDTYTIAWAWGPRVTAAKTPTKIRDWFVTNKKTGDITGPFYNFHEAKAWACATLGVGTEGPV